MTIPQRVGQSVLSILDVIGTETWLKNQSPSGGKEAFLLAFRARFWPYTSIVGLWVVVLAFDAVTGGVGIKLQSYGLILDLVGGVVIARGLFRSQSEIKAESEGTGFELAPKATVVSLDPGPIGRNTVDGLWGAMFFTIGFSTQIVAVSSGSVMSVVGLCTAIGIAYVGVTFINSTHL